MTPKPLAAAAVRLRGLPGRPRKHPLEASTQPPQGRALQEPTLNGRRREPKRQDVSDATENAPQLARVYTRIEPRLLGVEDAARYLGVGPTTVRDLVMSGRLPRVRLDELRRTLLDRLDLDAFIARSREHAR